MEEPQEKGVVAKFRSLPGAVQVIAVLVFVLVLCQISGTAAKYGLGLDTSGGTSRSPGSEAAPAQPRYLSQDNSTMAYIMAEEWVRERLKSPSTAEFPGIMDGRKAHTKKTGPGEYTITSYVDSQNSFGGVVRTRWTARLKQTSEDAWQLVEMQLE